MKPSDASLDLLCYISCLIEIVAGIYILLAAPTWLKLLGALIIIDSLVFAWFIFKTKNI